MTDASMSSGRFARFGHVARIAAVPVAIAVVVYLVVLLSNSALSVTSTGTGTGIVLLTNPAEQCRGPCTRSTPHGAVVVLTASPDPGSVFGGWLGSCASQGSTCELTITSDTSVVATFNQAQP